MAAEHAICGRSGRPLKGIRAYARLMTDDPTQYLPALARDAEYFQILSNCLTVETLGDWENGGLAAQSAADGLDQALGMLEKLTPERLAEIEERVKAMLAVLPPTIFD